MSYKEDLRSKLSEYPTKNIVFLFELGLNGCDTNIKLLDEFIRDGDVIHLNQYQERITHDKAVYELLYEEGNKAKKAGLCPQKIFEIIENLYSSGMKKINNAERMIQKVRKEMREK